MTALRSALKRVAEHTILMSGAAAFTRARLAGRAIVLAYHNVVPDGEAPAGERPLHLPQRAFAAQLDAIVRSHEVVPLADALGPARAGRPRVAITFDDAYVGTLSAGLDELRRRGLPATVFVPPAFVGGGTFWWDALAEGGALDAEVRRGALEECRGQDARVRAWAVARGLPTGALPAHARCADEDALRSAAAYDGLTYGSHTWAHANLARLDGPELDAELGPVLGWLRARFPRVSDALSYPYGQSSPAAAAAARRAGHTAALRVEGGWLASDGGEPLALPRYNVSAGLSLAGFRIRLSGLLCT